MVDFTTPSPPNPLHFHLMTHIYDREKYIEIETPDLFVITALHFQVSS